MSGGGKRTAYGFFSVASNVPVEKKEVPSVAEKAEVRVLGGDIEPYFWSFCGAILVGRGGLQSVGFKGSRCLK